MPSRQTYSCLTAVADAFAMIWAELSWLALEVWSGAVVALWEKWWRRR